jgi:hypothetical protein
MRTYTGMSHAWVETFFFDPTTAAGNVSVFSYTPLHSFKPENSDMIFPITLDLYRETAVKPCFDLRQRISHASRFARDVPVVNPIAPF